MSQKTGTPIRFSAALDTIDSATVVRVPAQASECLPSRGQVAVHGTIDGEDFRTVLEPDGEKGHWIRIDDAADRTTGDQVSFELEVSPDWPEPDVPPDLAAALATAPGEIQELWGDITPMARWEWVRWVNATANPATRRRRVEVTIDKMKSGKRRPCCFDLSACTDPAVAKNGKLRTVT